MRKHELIEPNQEGVLFDRVVSILEQARGNVVRAVNSNMVLAYWLIGREIVKEIQGGEERAEYGKQVLLELSANLNQRYGKGFSVPNLQNFRKFYHAFESRLGIWYPPGTKFPEAEIGHPSGDELLESPISHPLEGELESGFNPQLAWSHYRALMRVKDEKAWDFYEREAAECGWSKVQLERQIRTSYFERIIDNRGEEGLLPVGRERLPGDSLNPVHVLKSPMVLEFLDLPDDPGLHESKLEDAIITNLQSFLLELGKGFSFVARQKHIRFDEDDFYLDLVFYNYILKCFLLVDLKMDKLTHQDVGQMDGYVRLFEDQFKVEGDNPTIGLILCADKGEAVAKYSVLNESKQIFASKYLKFLPSEKELKQEIEKERLLIEASLSEKTLDE
ncbi:PDDEXK nuclease domain-containing protein [Pontiellaceae bacterium B1224]|nr:PDDEXK nuclease domain-containing protein [Pontiellaceae bacterium B1224]